MQVIVHRTSVIYNSLILSKKLHDPAKIEIT